MKQLSLILNVVLLIAVVWLFIAVYGGEKKSVTNSDTASSTSQNDSDFSIAYIMSDSLMLNLKMAEDLHDELSKEQQKYAQQSNSKRMSLEKDARAFQEKVQRGGFLTEASAQKENEMLTARAQKLQQEELEMSTKLQELTIKNSTTLRTTLVDYLKKLNEERKYSYIIMGESVLVGKDGYDITQEVLEALNKKYEKTNEGSDPNK
ncbi:MAG: OmpH family outer membrane protein [Bacteroidales bacterium]